MLPIAAQAASLSVNFRNVDIALVIESVAKLTGKNFIIDPRVKGRVTVLAAQPVDEKQLYDVLLTILHVYGYAAIAGDDITKIVPAAIARSYAPSYLGKEKHSLVTEVLKVKNNSSQQLVNVLRPMLSQNAHLVALANGNSLVVTDVRVNVERIKQILKKIDVVQERDYEIIQLNHAPVQSIISIVQSIYKNNNQSLSLNMQVDERTNRLILSASDDVRLAVRTLIADMDTPVSSEGSVRVIYLRFAKSENLAPVLESLISSEGFQGLVRAQTPGEELSSGTPSGETVRDEPQQQPTAPQNVSAPARSGDPGVLLGKTTVTADKELNALIISGSQAVINSLLAVIRQLDIPRAQVLIEVIIAEISESRLIELGLDWVLNKNGAAIADLSGALSNALKTRQGDPARDGLALSSLAGGKGLVTGLAEGDITNGWLALIRAIDSDGASNILSTPYIVTLDNEEASFVVGDDVPFVTGSYTGSGGASPENPFTTIERKEIGISLTVTPQINGANGIRLDLKQEVSNVAPNAVNAADLITAVRSIETTVQVDDGGIIVLGGLTSEQQFETQNRIPILGRIPLIGKLFRYQKSELRKNNLMLFMRPRILRSSADIAGLSYAKYNTLRSAQIGFNGIDSFIAGSDKPLLPDLRAEPLRVDYGSSTSLPGAPVDEDATTYKYDDPDNVPADGVEWRWQQTPASIRETQDASVSDIN